MGIETPIDPADIVNARAKAEGWPIVCESRLVFKRSELNLLRDLWRSQAAKTGMPRHSEFDAENIRGLLKRLTILERVSDEKGGARYRIEHQGGYMAAVMGDNAGHFIDEKIPPQLLPRWTTIFNAVLDSGAPLRVDVEFEFSRLNYAQAEAFVAPLSDENGSASLVLIGTYLTPRENVDGEPDSVA